MMRPQDIWQWYVGQRSSGEWDVWSPRKHGSPVHVAGPFDTQQEAKDWIAEHGE